MFEKNLFKFEFFSKNQLDNNILAKNHIVLKN